MVRITIKAARAGRPDDCRCPSGEGGMVLDILTLYLGVRSQKSKVDVLFLPISVLY
jgi:hypothetical protein